MVEDGYGVITMTFEDCGKNEIDIQNILPASPDAGEDIGDGSFEIQTVLSTGRTGEIYQYKTIHEDSVEANGWYKTGESKLSTKKFTLGDGLWYYSYWSNAKMKFNGQVETEAVDMPLAEDGYGVTGIARPASISIQDIVPHSESAGEDLGDGSFEIQTVLSTGRSGEIFQYKTTHEDSVAKTGWYKTGESNLSTKTFASGEGLWYYSYWDGAYFRLKALKDEIK